MTFKKYTRAQTERLKEIRLYKGGLIEISNLSMRELGDPNKVDLYWESETNSIGVKAAEVEGFDVRYNTPPATRCTINGQRFMRQFGILGIPARKAQAHFEDDLGMIVSTFEAVTVSGIHGDRS